jgi:mono/diheme cytochrome c family protein
VTIDPVRFRYKEGLLLVDSLINGSNGQWGLTHDNYGRLYFSRAAAGLAATGFQINPVYGQLELEDAFDSTFHMVWPIVKTPDVNGGPKTLRQDSTLHSFTSVAGQSVFRGDRLPSSMQGNYIAAEPVGRLIRRAVLSENEGQIRLQNKYREEEFISSNDLNFRPINTYTGPDGCLYIVDMYRGIIQESTWAQPGSFLYSQIMDKGLDKNVKNGRIYRLVHEDFLPGPKPNMLNESSQLLLSYLDHPNGWWRDNAQKELIFRMDTSVIPELRQIFVGEKENIGDPSSSLGRLHALWTLEGLEGINQHILMSAMEDEDPQVRIAAIRISETYLMNNDQQILKKLETMTGDQSEAVHQQMVLSLPFSSSDQARTLQTRLLRKNSENKVMAGILASQEKNKEAERYGSKLVSLSPEDREMVIKGSAIFKSLCESCHGPEGKGLPTEIAPPLISKFRLIEHKEGLIKLMLHGLQGPIEGETYDDIMPPMGANDDLWIASVLNYVRFDLGMKSFPEMPPSYLDWVIIKPDQVKEIRENHKSRKEPWTWEEIKNAS